MDIQIEGKNTYNRNSISSVFFSVARNNFNLKTQTLEWFNEVFGFTVQNGIFRVLSFRFDCFHYEQEDIDAAFVLQNECLKMVKDHLKGICHDVLLANDFLISRGLLNYSPAKEKQVREALESALAEIVGLPGTASTARITLGLSLPYREITESHQAMQEAMEAIWLRFTKGTGKVIEWEKGEALSASYVKTLENYKRKLKKACVLLDIKTFQETIKTFFSLPTRILSSMETRALLYEIESYMYEVNRDPISEFSDVALVHKSIRDAHKKASTLEEYFDCYAAHFTSLFEDIIKHTPKNNKMVREAEYFVRENIAREIRLRDVADQIGLNDVYFSHLFKKTTGTNFTDYVVGCKIDAAKTYLTRERMKMDAVASLTGFSDAKYFSKKFKEKEGITPSEYRKYHS